MVKVIHTSPDLEASQKQEELTGTLLQKIDTSSREAEAERLAGAAGLPYIDLAVFPVDGDDVRFFPRELAEKNQVVLFQKEGSLVRFGLINPKDNAIKETLRAYCEEKGLKMRLYGISEGSLQKTLEDYDEKPFIEHLDGLRVTLSGEELEAFEKDFGELLHLKENARDIPTSHMIEVVLAGANKLRASDIHIEPEADTVRLRYRIDGLLEDVGHLPEETYRLGLSRIKMLAKMKLNVRDRSQDGHFFIMKEDKRVDIRVSIIPSNHGETINMRLLNNEEANVSIEALGLRGGAFEEIKKQITKPHGMIVNTGPTGSGKTTTLYSLIREINTPSVKIITVEDPIEYALPGVVQTEVQSEAGYTFGQALRAIVRQDPDIILVGEIRDEETAEVAINAALTGHLVFSTLHTNDAAASIVRLAELGIKGSLIGSAVNIFIGQRLVRTLCKDCKVAYIPAPKTVSALKKILAGIPEKANVAVPKDIPTLYKPAGCTLCHFSGYRGRQGIFEVFPVSEKITATINNFASEEEIRQQARKEGMMTMHQDGILKVAEGITTFQEVWRNTGQDESLESLYQDILADPEVQNSEKEKSPSV